MKIKNVYVVATHSASWKQSPVSRVFESKKDAEAFRLRINTSWSGGSNGYHTYKRKVYYED